MIIVYFFLGLGIAATTALIVAILAQKKSVTRSEMIRYVRVSGACLTGTLIGCFGAHHLLVRLDKPIDTGLFLLIWLVFMVAGGLSVPMLFLWISAALSKPAKSRKTKSK